MLVSASQVRREGLADLNRLTTPTERRANEELLKLLDLIPARADMRAIQSSIYQEQVAGYYDPRTKRLALVRTAGAQDESIAEITLAHELTHALDDELFGIREQPQQAGDDQAAAYTALVEGDATSVMTRYAARYMSGANLLGLLFAGSSAAGVPPPPPYVQASLEFPYLEGQRFVDALYSYGKGWKLVNYAFRFHPPSSTAQILHPLEYILRKRPLPVRPRIRPLLGRDWRLAAGGTPGEFDLRQLLQRGVGPNRAEQVGAGWRGGSYQLWRRGPLPAASCASPCRSRDALVLVWRASSVAAAGQIGSGLSAYVARDLRGTRPAGGTWSLAGGAAAVASSGSRVSLALAPTRALAAALTAAPS